MKIPLGFIYSLESIVLVVKPSSISLKEFLTIMSGKISHFILILYYVFLKHIHTHLFILFIYHKLKQKQNTLCVSFYTCVSAGIGLEFSKMHQVRVFSLGKMINARDVFLNKFINSVQSLSLTLCDPTDCSTLGYHQLSELAQTHFH